MRPKPLMATFTFASVTVLTAAAWKGRRGERVSGVLSVPSPSHGFFVTIRGNFLFSSNTEKIIVFFWITLCEGTLTLTALPRLSPAVEPRKSTCGDEREGRRRAKMLVHDGAKCARPRLARGAAVLGDHTPLFSTPQRSLCEFFREPDQKFGVSASTSKACRAVGEKCSSRRRQLGSYLQGGGGGGESSHLAWSGEGTMLWGAEEWVKQTGNERW